MNRLLFSLVSASTFLVVIDVSQAQAASISSFEFRYSGSLTEAEGELQFVSDLVQSQLTGIGAESITLSELESLTFGQILFNFEYKVFDFISDGTNDVTLVNPTGDPIFYFDSGNLVGMDIDSNPSNYVLGGCRSFPCQTFNGTVRYQVRGNIAQEFITGSFFDIPDPFTEIETPVENALVNEGTIQFTTITAIPSVPNEPITTPEPFTIFGLLTTVFLGYGINNKSHLK